MARYSLGDRRIVTHGDEHFIADNATLIGSVILHNQTSVWYNAVIRGDSDVIAIGERTNIQDGAVLHTDPGIPMTIGSNVSVGHMAMLHGCTVGDNSLIGIGAIILNRAVIGKYCLVGAGAVIPEGKTYPEGVLIIGAPGKVIRELKPEERDGLLMNAEVYVRRLKQYRDKLTSAPS